MSNFLIRKAVRLMFAFTSDHQALKKSDLYLQRYNQLFQEMSPAAGEVSVEVPPMRGIDEDMRHWSFFMILEHNVIVNKSITATVLQLARGQDLHGAAAIDPKSDVMPSTSAGVYQMKLFSDSVAQHINVVSALGNLRGTKTSRHPVFGNFDAHQWNCMFSFHLQIHFRQAAYVVKRANVRY